MTTKVTAGWPVQVVGIPNYPKEVRTEVVLPFTVRDFYIHSGFRIISIEELPRGE